MGPLTVILKGKHGWNLSIVGAQRLDLLCISVSASFLLSNTYLGSSSFMMDGWMDDLRFYVLFDTVSVISGRWEVDN